MRFAATLEDYFYRADYMRIDPESREAITTSLVRAQCIRLAFRLRELGSSALGVQQWMSVVDTDPLPEVRFALSS